MILDIFSGLVSFVLNIIKSIISFFTTGFRFISDKTHYISDVLKAEKQRTKNIKSHFKNKKRTYRLNNEL